MIARSCLRRQQRASPICAPSGLRIHQHRPAVRYFHPSPFRRDDHGIPNHYETLEVPTDASPGEIKKQFYKLSKANHPDLHPNDSAAAQKFVKISEAYATLGTAEKKQRYDRDFLRSQPSSSGGNAAPRGSYSSAQSPAGGRPASGLSRRRTQFRGPPPSFYRSGGWGQHSEKRSEHASKASHSHEAQGSAQSGPAGPGAAEPGMGPGGFSAGFDNDVPHFDQRGHYQTHSGLEKGRARIRRKRGTSAEDLDFEGGASVLFNFIAVSGAIGVIWLASGVLLGRGAGEPRGKKGEEGGDKARDEGKDRMRE